MPSARDIAHHVLLRVEQGGAYANLALDAALETAGALDRRDAALCTELVYGTLRRRLSLDHALAKFSNRPLADLHPALREALRLGAYQILYLERVPDHAAVDSAVELVRARAPGGSEKYANAVLRAMLRGRGQVAPPDDPLERVSVEESHPRWLVERLWAQLGTEQTLAFLRADNEPAPTALRARLGRVTAEELCQKLRAEGLDAEVSRAAPQAVRVGGGSAQRTRAWADGLCTAQDEAAQLVGHLCAPAPGAKILDLCAAPGGKATHLAELCGESGSVLAVDVSERKLLDAAESAARMGLTNVTTLVADAREILPGVPLAAFDLVLLDAPCSGTGTLRRHPELRWRRTPEDVARVGETQSAILANAARYVRPGGVLVYAVCSVLDEEGAQQVERFLAGWPQFTLDGRPLATWPHQGGLDGFWAARLRMRGP